MRKLIEFLFGGIIEEIALSRAEQIIQDMVDEAVSGVHSEMEDRVESAVGEFRDCLDYKIDELEGRVDELQEEIDATKEEVDDMKEGA